MKEEIKRANQIKTKLGRWKVRSNLYKECEKDGKLLEKKPNWKPCKTKNP